MGQEISKTFTDNIGETFFDQEKSKDTITYCDKCKNFCLHADSDERNLEVCLRCKNKVSKSWIGVDENIGVPRFNTKGQEINLGPSFDKDLNFANEIHYCNHHDHYFANENNVGISTCKCKRLPSRTYKKV